MWVILEVSLQGLTQAWNIWTHVMIAYFNGNICVKTEQQAVIVSEQNNVDT